MIPKDRGEGGTHRTNWLIHPKYMAGNGESGNTTTESALHSFELRTDLLNQRVRGLQLFGGGGRKAGDFLS